MSSEIYSRIQSITDYAQRLKDIEALSETDKNLMLDTRTILGCVSICLTLLTELMHNLYTRTLSR